MKSWLVRIAALVIFAVSFALPALRLGAEPPASQIPGWTCAAFASIVGPKALVQSIGQSIRFEDVLTVIGGLVNYFFLAILVLSFWRRLVRTRLVLGALMIPCFIATWMFFASQKFTPLAGHYLWIAGAILIVVPDIAMLFAKSQPAPLAAGESAPRVEAGH